MSWSYSGNPASSDLDMVRFLIGDTLTADQLVQDEEINAILALETNTILCAARISEAIAAKYSRLADTTVGKTSITYSQKADSYLKLAIKLRKQKAMNARPIAYAGGISISDKENQKEDTDRTQPDFEKGIFESSSESIEGDLIGGSSTSALGDMRKAIYDPNGVYNDCFNMDNMIDGNTYVKTTNDYTNAELIKVSTAYSHSQLVAGNPHAVTKSDVGLGNVPNTDCTDADNISDGLTNAIITLTQESNFEDGYSHSQVVTGNPHSVTKSDVGLGNVPNTDCTTTANITDSLDKRFVTDAQLVVIGNTSGTNTGDQASGDFTHNSLSGLNDGTDYQHITTTQETNFETAYSHSQLVAGNPHSVTKTDVGLGNVVNTDTTDADNIVDGLTNAIITLTQETNFETAYTHSQLVAGNPHSVTKSDVGLGNVVNADTTTTANISDSLDKRFVTDAQLVVIGNTSGVNTGDQASGDFTHNDLGGLNDGATYQHITTTQETNFETAYTHSQLVVGNPHAVTASQVGALEDTNTYYSNIASATAIYVRFATIKIKSTYQKCNIKMHVGIGGNARDYGELEIQINGSSAYNTFLSSTHYSASSKVTHFADDTFTYVTVDNGANDYDIFLWAKVEAYAKLHCTIVDYYVENSTDMEVDLLPDTPTTSGTAPTGTSFDYRKENIITIDDDYFLALGGETSFTITLSYTSTTDKFYLYINGLKMIYGRHYSISGTTLSFLGGYSLTVNDEVEQIVYYNVLQ